MSVPAVSAPSPAATDPASIVRNPIQTLGQEDFIKILVTQLTTQDPMNPQKDSEFIGQMAQFSQLESSKSMTSELQTLRTQQDFLKANSLLGRQVQFDDGSGESTGYIGSVSGLEVVNGEPLLSVGTKTFSLADVVRVYPAASSRTSAN